MFLRDGVWIPLSRLRKINKEKKQKDDDKKKTSKNK